MNGLFRLGLRVLTVVFILLPVALWIWSAMTVTLVCALDESSATCANPNSGLDPVGFLKLAIIPWALAVLCSRTGKRLDLQLRR